MLLSVQNLTKRFSAEAAPVVDRVSFGVEAHEIFALLGPSGCGKTTILRLLAGFEQAEAGSIVLKDQVLNDARKFVRPEQRGIGFVFQEYALFPHLDVLQNVMFGLKEGDKKTRVARAQEMLKMVGLEKLADRKPHELSGGQQQRVALARAMAPTPKLILLDEPFSNLDAVLRHETRDELRRLLKKANMSAILVTHDQEEALSFADRVAVMQDGRIEQIGTPEQLYYQPRTLCVAQFLGLTNLFFSKAHGAQAETIIGDIPLNKTAEGTVLVALRPEHLEMKPCQASIPMAEVVGREFKGHDITYRVKRQGIEFLVHTDNRQWFEIGDKVQVKALEAGVVLERNP